MMYCKHCGTELAEGATFCPTCGKLVADGQDPFATDVQVEYVDPFTDEIKVESVPPMDGAEKTSLASKLLKKAIVGLVMGVACFMMSTIFTDVLFSLEEFGIAALFNLIFLGVNIASLVITCQARRAMYEYTSKYGETSGKASVGKGLSIPALIVNLLALAYHVILFLGSYALSL